MSLTTSHGTVNIIFDIFTVHSFYLILSTLSHMETCLDFIQPPCVFPLNNHVFHINLMQAMNMTLKR